MEDRTNALAHLVINDLDELVAAIQKETSEVIATGELVDVIIHFHAFREAVRELKARTGALQNHVDKLSEELLPTMMFNQKTKSIKVENVGNVVVNNRWSASMLNKAKAFDWLRQTGNQGLIIETVAAPTLGAFGKSMALVGTPLPPEIFKVSASPYISIRGAGETDEEDHG